jgi:hypothetical protein
VEGENVSVEGELEVEFEPGHRKRLRGRAAVHAQRSPTLHPLEPGSVFEPSLAFDTGMQSPLRFALHVEGGRLEVMVHQPSGGPNTTALLTSEVPGIDSFPEIFAVSWEAWLERMAVVSEECVLHKGTRPPPMPEPGVEPVVVDPEITEPVTVNAKVLRVELLQLSDRPCEMSARAKMKLRGFPGLADTTVVGTAAILDDARRIIWPTDPQPSKAGPAALVRLGGSGSDRINVPAPKWFTDSVPCAARQPASFEAELAAVPSQIGPKTSIRATWQTPCSQVYMSCQFKTHSQQRDPTMAHLPGASEDPTAVDSPESAPPSQGACPAGQIWKGDHCVGEHLPSPPTSPPVCRPGATKKADCNSCHCVRGYWKCTAKKCAPRRD